MKKVSIIMATYKTESKIIEESIESILKQTYQNIELILVCDGDYEEYKKIEKKYGNKIKLILNEENKGLPYSLNLGIENATGEYIARMDSDDISDKKRIEKQVIFLEKNENIDICGTDAKLFGDARGIKKIIFNNPEEIKIQLLFRATLIHPTIMAKKHVFSEFKYNENYKYAQDFELWSRMSEKYKFKILPIIGLNYRVHKKQITTQKANEQKKLSTTIIKNNLKKFLPKFDEKAYYTLCVLGGKEKITKNNYIDISENIDKIIEKNNIYDKKIFKKILYNRFFELMVKNKIVPQNINSLKKCLKLYNLKSILSRLL